MHPSASTGNKFEKSRGFFTVVLFAPAPIIPLLSAFTAPRKPPKIFFSFLRVAIIACLSRKTGLGQGGGGGSGKKKPERCGPV